MLKPASTAALICMATLTGAQAESLSGKALTETVAGSLVEIDTPLGTKIPIHYSDNGRISGYAKDLAAYLGAASDTGRWWVEDDQLCHKWLKWFKTEPQCLRIEKRGAKVNWRAQDGTTGTATIVSRAQTVAMAQPVQPPRTDRDDRARQTPAAATTSSIAMASAAPRTEKLEPPMRLTPPAALEEPQAATPPPPAKPAMSTPAVSVKRPAVVASASGAGLVSRSAAAASVMPAAKPATAAAPEIGAPPPSSQPAAAIGEPERSASGPLFKVANVDRDDVLNMRYGPSADTAPVGAIPYDGRGIALVGECQSGWCPVRHRGVDGWVWRAFLSGEDDAKAMVQPATFTRGYVESARRDAPDAPRSCLTSQARALLAQIEGKFGPVRLVSTCRAGATIAASGRPSKHASGNAIDFEAGSRKREVVDWLIANHHGGGTMTYADMDHVHIDIGPHFVSLGAPSGGGGRYSRRWSRWANSG